MYIICFASIVFYAAFNSILVISRRYLCKISVLPVYFILTPINQSINRYAVPATLASRREANKTVFKYLVWPDQESNSCLPTPKPNVSTTTSRLRNLSVKERSQYDHFKVFGMTRSGIEPWSHASIANVLNTTPRTRFYRGIHIDLGIIL